jgi:hypothetical protein
MPAGINEAFKSPFHTSNPASQLYDVNSYTRSSIQNEYYSSNQPENYRIQVEPRPTGPADQVELPHYQPSSYPQLHPYGQDDPNVTNAGWAQPRTSQAPTSPQLPPFSPCSPVPSSSSRPIATSSEDCDELINKVLSNKQCRQMLRQLFNDLPDRQDQVSDRQSIDPELIKNIAIYGIGGLLFLCTLDLVFKLGQLIKK